MIRFPGLVIRLRGPTLRGPTLRGPTLRVLAVLAVLAAAAPRAGADADLRTRVRVAALGRAYDDALFKKAAAAPRAATRAAAAYAAGQLKEQRALAWLLPRFRDGAAPVRRAAFFAAGQIGGDGVAIALRSALVGLGAPDLPRALEALGKTGDTRVVSAVAARLRHLDPAVRGAAALALVRLKDASALPDVFAALATEGDTEVRWRLVYAAAFLARDRGRKSGPVTLDPTAAGLLRAAGAPGRPHHERFFAVRGLAWTDGGRPFLVGLLDDDDPRIVAAALRGLAREWDPALADRAAALRTHPDKIVREAAVDHLVAAAATIGADDTEARTAAAARMRAALDVEPFRLHLRLRAAAAASGADVAVRAPPPGLSPAEVEELRWTVDTFYAGHAPTAAPQTPRGRLAAAEACGEDRIPAKVAVPILVGLLAVDDFTVQATAIGSLAKRKAGADAIVDAARRTRGTANMDVRIEAANALKALGHFDPWLVRTAGEDPDAPVRDAARAALESLGRTPPPVPPASGFRLHGRRAADVLESAAALRGARVRLETNRGAIEMVLFPDEAPAHCVNLVALVRKGFYDGLSWHRVVANFVIQGGCPLGNGWGGPGYTLPDEIGTRPYVRGTVGMPKAGDDTGGCQIFVTHLPTPHLDGRYTVFAQVVDGLDVVDRIRVGDRIEKATLVVR